MSIFALVSLFMMDNGKEELAVVFAGVVAWLWFCMVKFAEAINKTVKGYKYKSLLICPDGKFRYRSCYKTDEFLEEHDGYSFAKFSEYAAKEGWKLEEWNLAYVRGDCGNMRYTPRSVWKRYDKINEK